MNIDLAILSRLLETTTRLTDVLDDMRELPCGLSEHDLEDAIQAEYELELLLKRDGSIGDDKWKPKHYLGKT